MALIAQVTHCELAHRELLAVSEAAGDVIACASGELWLTQDGDRRDVVLPAGGQWRIEGAGEVVISALQPATFSITRQSAAVSRDRPVFELGRRFPPLALFPSPLIR